MANVELRAKTELTSIVGTENIYIQEAGSPFTVKRGLLNTLKTWMFSSDVGKIEMFALTSAPTNHIKCDGSALNTTTYAGLFAKIGYQYGGSGASFNAPNYNAVSPKGVGNQTINTRVKTGPAAVGSLIEDTGQEHLHEYGVFNDSVANGAGAGSRRPDVLQATLSTSVCKVSGTNGTPRTGAQTQDCTIGTLFCIRYQ